MSDFKTKMLQIRFRLGLCPRPCCGSLSAPPDPIAELSRDAPIRQWPPADNRRLTIGRLSADYRLIHKTDILTLISKTVSIDQIFYCII